jgi:hypothetical protein
MKMERGITRGKSKRNRQTRKRIGRGTKENNEKQEQEMSNTFVISMCVS